MSPRSSQARFFGKLANIIVRIGLALTLCLAVLIIAYRFLPPVSTLMLGRWIMGEPVERIYTPLNRIAFSLRAAVIVSEDGQFCRNDGVDWGALREVIDSADEDGPSRGASTITMQTVKNLFLWPTRSFIRKGFEIPLALLINMAWPKRRVLEVYLNIAEWGDGVFGAEAAARRYFHKSADRLDAAEAALLATALPNPRKRDPARPTRRHAALAALIMRRALATESLVACAR